MLDSAEAISDKETLMQLSVAQRAAYDRDRFLVFPDLVSAASPDRCVAKQRAETVPARGTVDDRRMKG